MESYNSDYEFFEEYFPKDFNNQRSWQKLTEDERERLRLAMLTLLNLEQGRDILFYLLEKSGLLSITFAGNSSIYIREGRRSIGREIYELLFLADPSAGYQKLINHGRELHARKNSKE